MGDATHFDEHPAAAGETTELRRQADALLDRLAVEPGSPMPTNYEEILHELRVHQIELQMQSEELRRTELGLDAQREKYFHLFDLAPVGYLTLSHQGIVGDANLTAVRMLRVERQILFGQPFSAFVVQEDRDILYQHFRALEKTDEPQTCELRLQRVSRDTDDDEGNTSQFWARLESRPQRTADAETLSTWVTFTDISARKLAEAALHESEDKFRFFFDRSVVPKSITLPSGEVQVNEAFCAMLGYAPIELEDRATWEQLTHADDVEETRRQMDDLISGRAVSARYEKRYVRKDGDVVWTDVSSSLRRDAGGQPLYFMTTMLDITERKRAEEAALQSAERHRAVLRTAMDGFWLMNTEGRILEVNEALCEISGYSEQELLTLGVVDLDVAEHADGAAAHIAKVIAEGEDRFETQHRRNDGSILDVEISTTFLPDNSGSLAVFVRDITADKQAERLMRATEEMHKSILAASPDDITITDLEGRIVMVSPAAFPMLRCTEEDVLGHSINDFIVAEDRERAASNVALMFEGTMTGPGEYRGLRPDGSTFDMESNAEFIRDADGEPAQLVFVTRDISERKTKERELDSAATRLEVLLEERERNLAQLAQSLSSIIEVVSQVVETRDPYTAGHERRVSELAVSIAQYMGMPAAQVEEIRIASLIHDVGKISVPTEILVKPGKLSPMEFELIKGHSEAGYRILSSVDLEGPTAEIVLQHHERCDGSGYPGGLTAEKLLEGSKVVMVADVVEAMSSHRPYRAALGIGPALAEIERGAGLQYDAAVAEACEKVFEAGFVFSEHQLLDSRDSNASPQGAVT